MGTSYVELTIDELMLLHKQGDQKATACIIGVLDGLMNKYSRVSPSSKEIDPDIKNSMVVICLTALKSFDISKYAD